MSKYFAKKTTVDGITFDSKKESDYYCTLKMQRMAGTIKDFDLQVEYELQPKYEYKGKTVRAIKYIADFVITYPDGRQKVVDVKGFRTREFVLKKKMLLFKNQGLDFEEI